MMENPRPEKENIIKDLWYKKSFRLEKETKATKGRILRDNKNLFEQEEENYYKPVRVRVFWSNNYIEYEGNSNRNKILSVEEYLYKIRPYLKDIINILKKFDTWKTHLAIATNLISSIDNDEEHITQS